MLTQALNYSVAGLAVTTDRLATVSKNINNANTEGYSRKVQEQISSVYGGVLPGPVQRLIDQAVVKELRGSTSQLGYFDARLGALDRLEQIDGNLESGNDLAAALSAFVSSLQQAAADPSRLSQLRQTVQDARTLADNFQRQWQSLGSAAEDIRALIRDDVSEVNRLLGDIETVNQQVINLRAGGNDATDAEDQRDRLVLQLSEKIQLSSFVDDRGALQLYSSDGQVELFNRTPAIITADADGALSADGRGFDAIAGSLAGHREVLTVTVPQRMAQLDAIAATMTSALTDAGLELFQDSGATFDPGANAGQEIGFAGRITVNAAMLADPALLRGPAGTAPGDATLLRAAESAVTAGNLTFSAAGLPMTGSLTGVTAEMLASHASEIESTRSRRESMAAVHTAVSSRHAATTEVNLDDELAFMLILQNGYAASARVLQTTQEMLDELLRSV